MILGSGMYRTPRILNYNREKAVEYAHKWALTRNPKYLDFEKYGGDCTNFVSQAIYSGSGVMNYKPVYGWFYINSGNRTASWTGVDYLHNFLVKNKGNGPFAEIVDEKDVKPGDIVQLSFHGGNDYNHSLMVVKTGVTPSKDNILICTHTYDRDNYPLTEYTWEEIRYLHIAGVRKT